MPKKAKTNKNPIPAREQWMHDNPEILERVKQGLRESASGKVVDLGTFHDKLRRKRKTRP